MFLNSIFFSTQIFSFKHTYYTKETQKKIFTSNTVDCCLRNMDAAYKQNNFNFFCFNFNFFCFQNQSKKFQLFYPQCLFSLSQQKKSIHYNNITVKKFFKWYFQKKISFPCRLEDNQFLQQKYNI